MSDKLVANNTGSAENAHVGAHPYRLQSAICYLLLHSSLWRECASFDVCAAKHYAPASPAPRKAAGQTEHSWTLASSRNSALSWETAA
jgi:hypothetical protein